MKIVEMFYSLQGEGRFVGKPCVFLRLSGCPLKCKWCDTKYALQNRCGDEMSIDEIALKLKGYDCRHIVITGGEPFVNTELKELVMAIRPLANHITVETAGIKYLPDLPIDLVSISPKLSNSTPTEANNAAIHEENRLNLMALSDFMNSYKCQLKFVIESQADIDEAESVLKKTGCSQDTEVMLMPQATDSEQYSLKAKEVADICISTGYSFSPRLHVMLWGNKRGV